MPTSTRRTGRTASLVAAAALCTVALTACGSAGSNTTATSPKSTPMSSMTKGSGTSMGSGQAGMKGMIMIKNFTFSTPASVQAGASVMVMNQDSEAHSVTADSGDAFDVTIPPGKTAVLTAPDKPGSYPFHCMYHSDMHGTLRVR